jgi:hypothetical protein
MNTLLAQLSNPAVPAVDKVIKTAASTDSGVAGATLMAHYIAILLQTSMVLGGLAVILFFAQGALEWITAGGDHGKVEKAQNRMTNAVIGLGVLSAVVALVGFIGPVFGMDLLKPVFINQIK